MFGPALTLILVLVSSAVIAVPTVNNVYKRAVASLNPSSTELPFYFPESIYESIPHSGAVPSPSSSEDGVKTATDFISKRLNLSANDFKVANSFTDLSGISHVYGAHMINGASISNHQAAAHVNNGEVAFFSTSFGTEQHLAKRDLTVSAPEATLSFEEASAIASTQLGIPVYSEFEHTLEYVAQPDGKVVYAYKLQLRNTPVTKWVQVWCHADTGRVIQVVNFANEASYMSSDFLIVIPLMGFQRDGVFDTKFNSQEEPGTAANIAATAVNLFYLANVMHDISYQYGFTEIAGNFQKSNFGKVVQGGDAVTINVLNSSNSNDAGFFTPPDGQPGVMNMYRFTYTTPDRNPGFDNGIPIHEYAHGISNRLTGGPSTGGCLSTLEARGMGEGWSDIIFMIVLAKSSDTATTGIPIGAYVRNNPKGIRSHPYTTDMTVNPLTYVNLKFAGGAYAVANLYKTDQSAGNIVAMQIIIGGMMIQSCNPTFLDARDAIISADDPHYKSANKCEI
ncbi:hypothetical protein BASA60_005643 [Batrachochytrium salamandrivorans]|nr:hypothetical protein BASA60_005643 [Batrachochytrium salamandrivorans]